MYKNANMPLHFLLIPVLSQNKMLQFDGSNTMTPKIHIRLKNNA